MERRRLKTFIGLAMVALGLIQVASFGISDDPLFSAFGLLYAVIGAAFLWTEVYRSEA